jgi:hypothetical protein
MGVGSYHYFWVFFHRGHIERLIKYNCNCNCIKEIHTNLVKKLSWLTKGTTINIIILKKLFSIKEIVINCI